MLFSSFCVYAIRSHLQGKLTSFPVKTHSYAGLTKIPWFWHTVSTSLILPMHDDAISAASGCVISIWFALNIMKFVRSICSWSSLGFTCLDYPQMKAATKVKSSQVSFLSWRSVYGLFIRVQSITVQMKIVLTVAFYADVERVCFWITIDYTFANKLTADTIFES